MKSSDPFPNLHGFLNLHKPPGVTSQQVVAGIRRPLGLKVGHCGTLDPPASGVLPICLGAATRLTDQIHKFEKGYEVWATFGISTTTLDAQGQVTLRQPQPALSAPDLKAVLGRFQGQIQQIPPLVSALHFHGRRLYQLALRGEAVEPLPRTVSVHRLRLLSFQKGDFPVARLEVACSSGTYIRSLCRDIGATLGCPAHASRLVRTRVGPFRLEHSVPLSTALEAAKGGSLAQHVIPPQRLPLGLPVLCVDEDIGYEISHGNEVVFSSHSTPEPYSASPWQLSSAQLLLVTNPAGSLLALCEVRQAEGGPVGDPTGDARGKLTLRPRKVLLGAAGNSLQ